VILLWIIQIGVDLILVGAILFWLRERMIAKVHSSSDKFEVAMQLLEGRAKQLEMDSLVSREKVETQLERLTKICDEASRILSRETSQEANFTPTIEEFELKSALQAPQAIPTLEQIERTEQRLKTEIQFNLRSLLSDQLC